MSDGTIIPNPAKVLRELVTGAGFRSAIFKKGHDKDLDDMAIESRGSSTCDLMMELEHMLFKFVEKDCGRNFSEFCRWSWSKARETLQAVSQHVDTSTMADQQGKDLVRRVLVVPMLSSFFSAASNALRGPEDNSRWWDSPFSAWVNWASAWIGVPKSEFLDRLANHVDVDQRTVERWQKGAPLGLLSYPYRKVAVAASCEEHEPQTDSSTIDQITAWLILAVSFQSLPSDLRQAVKSYRESGRRLNWTLGAAINELGKSAASRGQGPLFEEMAPLVRQITELLSEPELDHSAVQEALSELQVSISRDAGLLRRGCQFTHDWLAARFAARTGKEAKALDLYKAAVDGVWWYGGQAQTRIIREALLYAIGVGDKVAAEWYWDKAFLLGLNEWPKRPLDDQELRRLAMGFEREFFPQKAKVRVPPPFEVIHRDGPFALTRQQLANPNRKAKFAEGRTRRTPLMEAVQQGTVEEVRRLLDARGNPDEFIPESGQGPLSLAMDRACNRKDPTIMEHLLSLDLSRETVNRRFSTQRETPLKL
ncbi:MAG: hypothetical protein HIU82_10585, partial [Proteobacteria bacterium]|nr:hypothetical protein [Pseudomonadota bacterium]